MHVACLVQLAHCGVDEGVACFSGAPGLEEVGVVVPGYVCIFGFEGFVHTGEGVSWSYCWRKWVGRGEGRAYHMYGQ